MTLTFLEPATTSPGTGLSNQNDFPTFYDPTLTVKNYPIISWSLFLEGENKNKKEIKKLKKLKKLQKKIRKLKKKLSLIY